MAHCTLDFYRKAWEMWKKSPFDMGFRKNVAEDYQEYLGKIPEEFLESVDMVKELAEFATSEFDARLAKANLIKV